MSTLAPKKPGFDLARDLAKKMEKLERETQYCIAEEIRKRLKSSADISDTGAGYALANNDMDDDDN